MAESDPCRVVVCDDQDAFRQLLSVVLGLEQGIEVVGEATNGEEAIRVVGELRPDVLLLDVAMPVLDGIEALPRIRQASPETRVVMLTALTSENVRRSALDAGARLFVEKGGDIDEIADQITAVCVD